MSKTKFTNFILTMLITGGFIVDNSAQEPAALFNEANKYAENEEFSKAAETYQQLLKTGVQSAEIEYNLANTYLRMNELGEAILHYERAALLAPGDADIAQNLRLARERIESDIAPTPTFFLADTWNGLQDSLSSGLWSVLFLLVLAAAVGGFILWQLGTERTRRKQGFFAGVGLLPVALILFLLASGKARKEYNSGLGIVMTNKVALHAGAEENSPVIRELREGMKVKVSDNINNWYKVKLVNGEEGWLAKDVFELI